MNRKSIKPIFGLNYKPGQIGFTMHKPGLNISTGISFYESSILNLIKGEFIPSHVFIVTGENEGVESTYETGVHAFKLEKYFDSENIITVLREPALLELKGSAGIVNAAVSDIGRPYDERLIAGHLISKSKLISCLMTENAKKRILKKLNASGAICSEKAYEALDNKQASVVPEYLREPAYVWDPVYLFCSLIFKPWKDSVQDLKQFRSA